jgi:leader peptidase (prepilin peptidase) / N-methyltransferase
MIAEYMAGKLALAVFALICAWQDIKTMSIRQETAAAGILMLVLGTLGLMLAGSEGISHRAVLIFGLDMMLGCLPGIMLLAVSRMTGQIGAGDGIYFVIVGASLGLKRAVIFMMLTLFLNAIISAGILLKSGIAGYGRQNKRADVLKRKLPFLPAAGAVLIWMLAEGGGC